MTENDTAGRGLQMLAFSNGVSVDYAQIVCIESNQQRIPFPGDVSELAHLLNGRPSNLLVRLRDGSTVEINAGNVRLEIRVPDRT